jgi:hypothetical protein
MASQPGYDDMDALQPQSLMAAARLHWRTFVPAWIFPIVLLFGFQAANALGHAMAFWSLVLTPLFFWSFVRWASLWLEDRICYWHSVALGVLLPCIIWIAAAASQLVADGLRRLA